MLKNYSSCGLLSFVECMENESNKGISLVKCVGLQPQTGPNEGRA